MSVQNYTCYHYTTPDTVHQCFQPSQGKGVYIPAVNSSGARCAYDDSYFGNMAKAQQSTGVAPIAMVDATRSLASLEPMADCISRGKAQGVKWGGAFIDYEQASSCPQIQPLRAALGGDQPIYAYANPASGASCYDSEWKTAANVVPVYPCYGGSRICGPAGPGYPTNTPTSHYIYQEPHLPPGGVYDLYDP